MGSAANDPQHPDRHHSRHGRSFAALQAAALEEKRLEEDRLGLALTIAKAVAEQGETQAKGTKR